MSCHEPRWARAWRGGQIGGEGVANGGQVALGERCGREAGAAKVMSCMAGLQWFSGAGGLVVAR